MIADRPLPGIVFRNAPPPTAALPRMDVAALVGFAESGPLHTPVAIEEPARFREIFGDPPLLAWDVERNRPQRACLGQAVQDFFAQGGRRCWVVRVAGSQAVTHHFPVAGALRVGADGLEPARLAARSPGSWADSLHAGATLLARPLGLGPLTVEPPFGLAAELACTLVPPVDLVLQPGDLVQLGFDDAEGRRAYLHLRTVEIAAAGRPIQVTGRAYWFHPPVAGAVTAGEATLPYLGRAASVQAEYDPDARRLALAPGATLAAMPGDWIRFVAADGVIWLLVEAATAHGIAIAQAWQEGAAPGAAPLTAVRAARLSLAVEARRYAQPLARLEELACGAPHPRFIGYLPADETLFRLAAGEPEAPDGPPGAPLWAAATAPRFPLAAVEGGEQDGGPWLPLALGVTVPAWQGPLPTAGDALQRDGLVPPTGDPAQLNGAAWAEFMASIFLDPALRETRQAALAAAVFDLRYSQGRQLRGLHSLWGLDEVSLIALPDAAHRGWRPLAQVILPPPPPPPAPPLPPPCPGHELFRPKGEEEKTGDEPAEEPATPLQTPPPPAQWQMLAPDEFVPAGLLAIHLAAVQMAAARADLTAVLGLPAHYRAQEALDHRAQLAGELARHASPTAPSYGALYHPWLLMPTPAGGPADVGPEGAVCGLIAARTLARGAWIAPANLPVQGALGLSPDLEPARLRDLYQAGVNLVVRQAGDFTLLAADTLSDDPDLRPLQVRRLLILLRRLALREGQEMVFAPNSPAFRRRVARTLERLLAHLFSRGAFAGRDPAQSYQVAAEETANPPAGVEQGRFVVELRIAPAQPLSFLTVRLVQTDAGALAAQEGAPRA
ncbi:MAG TPA: hypothetical protein VNK95_16695 [Caldilineaceae bacterium]|nr:hypothetical protein [Caldilineaceae bacterium]